MPPTCNLANPFAADHVGAATADDIAVSPATLADMDWFGRSQLVDGAGRSRIVYRGETDGVLFDQFDLRCTNARVGFFFATDPAHAQSYAGHGTDARAFCLKVKRLLDLTDPYDPAVRDFVRRFGAEFDSWIDRRSGDVVSAFDYLEAGDLYDYEGTGSGTRWNRLFSLAQELGYDGVEVLDVTDGFSASIVVVFEPAQIRLLQEPVAQPRHRRSPEIR